MRQLQRKILTGEMKFLYVFLNSVAAKECCWKSWGDWQQSSLTCGELCKHRKRAICVFDVTSDWCLDTKCNHHHTGTECPSYETQTGSCENIKCRELIF